VNAEMPTPSQAMRGRMEGVTTRGVLLDQLCGPHEPPARFKKREEIVWPCAKSKRKKHRIKNRCGNRSTTIQNRSGELADNVTNNNALLRELKMRGNVKPFGGGNVILQEIMYVDSSTINANSYSGYEVLNISPNSPISAAQYSIAQYAGAVSISGLEILQNSGKEQIIDLMEGRIEIANAELMNRIDYDLYQDGKQTSAVLH